MAAIMAMKIVRKRMRNRKEDGEEKKGCERKRVGDKEKGYEKVICGRAQYSRPGKSFVSRVLEAWWSLWRFVGLFGVILTRPGKVYNAERIAWACGCLRDKDTIWSDLIFKCQYWKSCWDGRKVVGMGWERSPTRWSFGRRRVHGLSVRVCVNDFIFGKRDKPIFKQLNIEISRRRRGPKSIMAWGASWVETWESCLGLRREREMYFSTRRGLEVRKGWCM